MRGIWVEIVFGVGDVAKRGGGIVCVAPAAVVVADAAFAGGIGVIDLPGDMCIIECVEDVGKAERAKVVIVTLVKGETLRWCLR